MIFTIDLTENEVRRLFELTDIDVDFVDQYTDDEDVEDAIKILITNS